MSESSTKPPRLSAQECSAFANAGGVSSEWQSAQLGVVVAGSGNWWCPSKTKGASVAPTGERSLWVNCNQSESVLEWGVTESGTSSVGS